MADALLAVDVVAARLRDAATRRETLDALDTHAPPVPTALAFAAAPALLELQTLDAAELERSEFDQATLLLARLHVEALPDPLPIHRAAWVTTELEVWFAANNVVNSELLRKPASEVSIADVTSYACLQSCEVIANVRGYDVEYAAEGFPNAIDRMVQFAKDELTARVDPEVLQRLMTLSLELLRSDELPELAVCGAWQAVFFCLARATRAPGGAMVAAGLDSGLHDVAVACLNRIGRPAQWISISRGSVDAIRILEAVNRGSRCPDDAKMKQTLHAACVSSGVYDLCIEAVVAFAEAGVDGLLNTNTPAICCSLSLLSACHAHPGCATKIRAGNVPQALAFCLEPEHSLVMCEPKGDSSGSLAAQVVCSAFGKDEADSVFRFTQTQVDHLVARWSMMFFGFGPARGRSYSFTLPSPETIFSLQLCISDANKPILLKNADFLPYLVVSKLTQSGYLYM